MKIRPVQVINKVWGHEEIIVNNGIYCGKKLCLNKRYRCSIHRHPKRETFYIESGKVYLELEMQNEEYDKEILSPGDIVDIDLNKRHRFSGLEDSVIFEFSSPDTESERYTQSEPIPDFENWRKTILGE
jgi:quercetin dioxygenase-like cupin family protein